MLLQTYDKKPNKSGFKVLIIRNLLVAFTSGSSFYITDRYSSGYAGFFMHPETFFRLCFYRQMYDFSMIKK